MPAPTAADSARTGTPDGTSGIQVATTVLQEDANKEGPWGVAITRQIPDGAAADRTVTAADSATDMSTSGFGSSGLIALNNAGAVEVFATFESSSDSATIRLVFYDLAGNVRGLGPAMTFTPQSGFRLTATGHYLCEVASLIESYGRQKCKPYVVSKGNTVDDLAIYVFPL